MPNEVNSVEQEKVISLFQYIRELNKLKTKPVLNMKDHPWAFMLADLPDDPDHIKVSYRDRVEHDDNDSGDLLLSVTKPEFQSCPNPDPRFVEWLEQGWEDWRNKNASVKDVIIKAAATEKGKRKAEEYQISLEFDAEETVTENFSDDPTRVELFEKWQIVRAEWVAKQEITAKTLSLFTDLYRLTFELDREAETLEIIAANGVLLDKKDSAINHPVLTRRVKLSFNANTNTVSIEDTDTASELYSIVFQMMKDINLDAISELNSTLQGEDYHPLDRNETPDFLKILVHRISSESMFSVEGIPDNWKENSRILLANSPCYIVRKRLDGTLKAIENIIENVMESGSVPNPIRDIVSGGTIEIPDDSEEESIEEQLAAVGGESVDILLSKEANKEQLEIANRIERYNAVLVQGPPGTGKTHTIANLMGHFLSQGKSVLVTSHTTKALSVLKEKVAPGLQNLCVSILDDSNVDMEKSIDGITGYMAKTTSHELKREMDAVARQRRAIIADLAETRKKMFLLIKQECGSIVYNGNSISPSEAARFVVDNSDTLSYIPGTVRLDLPLPLSFEQLSTLYRSNGGISTDDEAELLHNLPDPSSIPSPADFSELVETYNSALSRFKQLQSESVLPVAVDSATKMITFKLEQTALSIPYPDRKDLTVIKDYIASLGRIDTWMKAAAVDGKNGGGYRQKWLILSDQIAKTCDYSDSIISEQFGHNIVFLHPDNKSDIQKAIMDLREVLAQKGKVSKLQLWGNKNLKIALEEVSFDGNSLNSASDCDVVLHIIELEALRKQCAVYWNQLLSVHGVPAFTELDLHAPEQIAKNWLPSIAKYLDWYANDYEQLCDYLTNMSVQPNQLFGITSMDSDLTATDKILTCISQRIPLLCDTCTAVLNIEACENQFRSIKNVLRAEKRMSSRVCSSVLHAVKNVDSAEYASTYEVLQNVYEKYELQRNRELLLNELGSVAPDWANAIRNREGIHGEASVPADVESAWKWKQLSGIIEDILSQPFNELHAKSVQLSRDYRKTTALYAEKCGWYHLLKQTEHDIDMKQALQGWKLTVKKIGKGTGKNAPQLKAKARELMAKCQRAVPGWIMPINRALESLNPKENQFDIIIIDEASQSDISSLAILYMGKKLIIVGDDKQVSPMAVGVEVDKLNALKKMYIEDKIPNAHLYDAKTSIYDIAATTFQPLMLREHFRCVPEIIGFSNMLSYDFKIKPLRDASNSVLLPAVVSYRAENGKRQGNKTNPVEAQNIIALMKSCMEQPEYAGKSFGIISLLGDEQVKVLQRLIEEEIDPKEIISRRILCGNSAHFQGDERDVIFLSVVDSSDGTGPLHLQSYGVDDAFRKRYNVAVSRARDQLWVVHSLDPASDLKPGDIRKTLIDYAINPNAIEVQLSEVAEKSESPFEQSVASSLVGRGFHIIQQWPVGAYRLDMVVVSGQKRVAIECDGERWHSGEDKVREDMERQTILERLGWRFIRIRGSEYYRNPEATMDRVFHELEEYGIAPEQVDAPINSERETELLKRVKVRAAILLAEKSDDDTLDSDTIAAALDSKNEQPDPAGSQGQQAVQRIIESDCNPEQRVQDKAKPNSGKKASSASMKSKSAEVGTPIQPLFAELHSAPATLKQNIILPQPAQKVKPPAQTKTTPKSSPREDYQFVLDDVLAMQNQASSSNAAESAGRKLSPNKTEPQFPKPSKLTLPEKSAFQMPQATASNGKEKAQKVIEAAGAKPHSSEPKVLSEKHTKLTLPEKPKFQMPQAKKPVTQGKQSVPKQEASATPSSKSDIISLLEKHHVKYVDKRANNGALWIIGGHELDDVVKQAKAIGVRFVFKADGGRATKGAPGWWAK